MSHLVIAPHPDDEAIGMGGRIRQITDSGETVHVVFLTSGDKMGNPEAREEEAVAASWFLGNKTHFLRTPDGECAAHKSEIAKQLVEWLRLLDPLHVYIPHAGETHPDHAVVSSILSLALKNRPYPRPHVRGYEVWTPMSRLAGVFDVTAVMPKKLASLRKYTSQLAGLPIDKGALGLARYRGCFVGRCRYAEVFGPDELE